MVGRRSLMAGLFGWILSRAVGLARADPTDDEKFRDEVIVILRRHRHDLSVSPALESGSLKIAPTDPSSDVREFTANLDNLMLAVRNLKGSEREEAILQFMDAALAPSQDSDPFADEDFPTQSSQLRPQIIADSHLGADVDLVTQSLSPRAKIAYVIDMGGSYRFVAPRTLKAWQVDQEAVHKIAVANLERISAAVTFEVSEGDNGRYTLISAQDGYDAARLILPEFMRRLRLALGADVYAAVPTRDFLIVWTGKLRSRENVLQVIAESFKSGPYSRTDEIFFSSDAGLRVASVEEMLGREL